MLLTREEVSADCVSVCVHLFPVLLEHTAQRSSLLSLRERAVRDVVLGEQQRLLLEPGLAQVYLRTFPVGVWLACLSVTVPACVRV